MVSVFVFCTSQTCLLMEEYMCIHVECSRGKPVVKINYDSISCEEITKKCSQLEFHLSLSHDNDYIYSNVVAVEY